MNKKLFIMNKKLLMGLGSALILSTPILVATSCGDNGVKVSGYQLLKDETDTNKIIIRINGQNFSTKSEDWQITDSNNTAVYNVWTLDTIKSNSNSVYFSATKGDTKGKTYSFSCNGTNMISNFSTPFAPTSISSTEGLNAFKGYQGTNKNPESSDQNKANISITGLTVNFEFKNVSQNSAQFMKLILPSQLGNVFENYQGYNERISIKWSLKDTNSDFEITNNTLISTKPIDPTAIQNVTLVGSLNMNGWEDTFEIKVNFSNEAQDIQINSVTSKIEQDKVIVTVAGSKLPTDRTKWTFKENNNTESSEWTLSSSPSATETQVTFEAAYANVIGKTFTIEGTGTGSTASKEFTVPVSTISSIASEMTDEGDLKLTVTGTNLSSAKSLYVFNFVEAAASTYTNTNPSIDVNQISLTWTNSSQIVFTIKKQNDQGQTLTKDLYGAKFSLQIQNQTPATRFTFGDYVAPTAIIKDQFFKNVLEGTSESSIATKVNLDKITGDNLSYTITTSAADNKFVSIYLPKSSDNGSTNIFDFLSGQKGFTTSGNNTTLTWSISDDQKTNWEYNESSSTLKNKTALTTDTNPTIAVTGTITDTITSRAKTFTLNLTLVLFNSNSVINDPAISWVSEEGENKGKKIKVTFTGTGLPTNQSGWTITPKDSSYSSSSTLPTWKIDSSSSSTSVSFTIEFNKDTIGKSYTFAVTGIQGAKDVTIPISTITDINSSINKNGDLILGFTGNNLSANLDTYIFAFKDTGTASPATTFGGEEPTTPPIIDDTFKQNIDVVWTSEKSITLTIKKVLGDGSQTAITKGLYGLKYEVNVINQGEKKEFTFEDYVVPKGVKVDIFDESLCGESKDKTNDSIESSAFQGDKLSWTLTVENSASKWVKIKFKQTNFLGSLVDQLGFGENNNGTTTLTWTLKENADNNSKFTYSDSEGLKNNEELTISGITAVMTGTLTDTLTGVVKTFDLSLTIKMTDNPVKRISSASSEITDNGDLKILLKGSNLPKEANKYNFTYSGSGTAGTSTLDSTTNTPIVDSNILELDTTHTNTGSSVQFIIKKIKNTTPSAPSGYASPTVQTKGLYGKTFSVTLVDTASNTSSRDEEQPPVEEKLVTFTFANYVKPTGIESSKFFEEVDSLTQNAVSSLQNGGDLQQKPDFFPLTTKENILKGNDDLEWTITSPYKSHNYIYLVLPSSDEILDSVIGWKGFSKNLPSSPDLSQGTYTDSNPGDYTSVSWKFKNGTTNDKFEGLSDNSSNILYNKDPLTENTPISATLTATIKDNLTGEIVSFDIKITFTLGTLDDPTINENPTLSNDNNNVKVTITGTNLPTDIKQWNIEESKSNSSQLPNEGEKASKSSQQAEEGGTSNSNPWTITSTPSSTSIEFSAEQKQVAGKTYNFSLVGFPNVKTAVTCPTNLDADQK